MHQNVDLHLHLEGSLPVEDAVRIAADAGHPWGMLEAKTLRRSFRYRAFNEFLATIREMCSVVAAPGGLEAAAAAVSRESGRFGVRYVEVYVSPYIYMRWGARWEDVVRRCEEGFASAEQAGGARCAVLLDTVRQWTPEATTEMLNAYERQPWSRVIGLGIGGAETYPLEEFRDVFARARALGLRTVAHAGEGAGFADVRVALDVLRVDRIAHGIRAIDDPRLLSDLSRTGVPLDVAVSSNYRTHVVRTVPHPLRRLLDAGVRVSLGTDDPSLFRTNIRREMLAARRAAQLSEREIRALSRNAIEHSFASDSLKRELRADLDRRYGSSDAPARAVPSPHPPASAEPEA